MYKEIKGGECFDIYGLKCWRPPVPPEHEIKNSHLPKKDQKWIRNGLPSFSAEDIEIFSGTEYAPGEMLSYENCVREETIKQTGTDPWRMGQNKKPMPVPGVKPDPLYKSKPLFYFRKKELDRCDPWTGGFWFMNNGRPTWLTPFHYFYLNWWKIPGGYPNYYFVDEESFYFWQYIFESPVDYGMLEIQKRGCGKSFRVAAITYLRTVYGSKIYSGIQSKNDKDAETFFLKKMVVPYKELPDFFIPTNTHGTDPKTEMVFNADSSRGADSQYHRKKQREALGSTIDFRNAGENAYDSQDITGVLVQDEVGKTLKRVADVYVRHNVNKNCVYRDGRLLGKIIATTTVEKLAKGGEQFKKMYNASRPETIDRETGITISGLRTMFIPAWKAEFKDEYGMPDIERGRRDQGREREKLKKADPEAYLDYCLMYPWDEADIFKALDSDCIFDMEVLQGNERRFNEFGETYQVRVGNFILNEREDGSKYSEWEDDPDGRWHVSYLWPDESMANDYDYYHDFEGKVHYQPKNDDIIRAGYDPSKGGKNIDKRSSKDAITFYMMAGGDSECAETPIADYLYEVADPETAYKDLVAGMLYYSNPVLVENNIRDPINWLKRNGFADFVMDRPMNTMTNPNATPNEGMPSSDSTIDIQEKRAKSYITVHGHRIKHYRLNNCLMQYTGANRTKRDASVSFMVSLLAADDYNPVKRESIEIGRVIRIYDNSGNQSSVRDYNNNNYG